MEREITKCVSRIQWYEGQIQGYESDIAETRGRGEERQRKEGECRVVMSNDLTEHVHILYV